MEPKIGELEYNISKMEENVRNTMKEKLSIP